MPSQSDLEIIQGLRNGDDSAINATYIALKPKFLAWAKGKCQLHLSDLEACFNDSIIAFVEQIRSKANFTLEKSIESYLFGIFNNKLYKNLGKLGQIPKHIGFDIQYDFAEEEPIEDKQREIVQKAMNSLTEQEQSLILDHFYNYKSIQEICEKWNHANTGVTTTRISQARAKLIEIIKNSSSRIYV